MKKIMFDCAFAQPSKRITVNGGGEYTIRILEELLKRDNIEITLLTNTNKGKVVFLENLVISNIIKRYSYRDFDDLSNYINSQLPDVFYCPVVNGNYSQLKIDDRVRVILGLHDLNEIYNNMIPCRKGMFIKPDHLNFLRYFKRFIERRIIVKRQLRQHQTLFLINKKTDIYTVSHYTASAINYWFEKSRILGVFYSPIKASSTYQDIDDKNVLLSYGVTTHNFFLASSARRWTKNNLIAIESFDEMISSRKISEQMKFLVLGCDENYKRYIFHKVKNKNNFILFDYIDSDELEVLYRNAYIFVYPSLVEGFGYPPIEAMKYGTTSICSNYTSIPEICGDAVVYFNPNDKTSLKMAILRAMDKVYYTDKKKKSLQRYQDLLIKMKNDNDKLIDEFIVGT